MHLNALPNDILILTFSYNTTKKLSNVSLVNRRFNEVAFEGDPNYKATRNKKIENKYQTKAKAISDEKALYAAYIAASIAKEDAKNNRRSFLGMPTRVLRFF